MQQEFRLQDPGEGIREVDILEVLVAEGDEVSEGQDVLVVESDKAAIELPSPFAGTIEELRVKEGDTAVVGDVLLVVEDGTDAEDAPAKEDAAGEAEDDRSGAREPEDAPEDPEDTREEEEKETPEEEETPEGPSELPDGSREAAEDTEREAAEGGGAEKAGGAPVHASPAARKLARERGVDLADLEASGADGQVTVEDVEAAAPTKERKDEDPAQQDDFGPVERRRMSSIRAATARAMTRSWSDIPHVVHEDAADITELELWRRRQGDDAPTLTPIVAKAAAIVLADHPRFNAMLDAETGEIVLRHYWNINIAVATDRGLVTPVVKGVDGKSIRELADEMAALADKARKRKLKQADIAGGTFTITNVGGLGGRGLSPLINAPQTAILGLARARIEAVATGDIGGEARAEARMILPLALAFDHRVIDGADAARFCNDLIALLKDPVSLALDA